MLINGEKNPLLRLNTVMEEYKAADGEESPGRFGQGKACWVQQHKEGGGAEGWTFSIFNRIFTVNTSRDVKNIKSRHLQKGSDVIFESLSLIRYFRVTEAEISPVRKRCFGL